MNLWKSDWFWIMVQQNDFKKQTNKAGLDNNYSTFTKYLVAQPSITGNTAVSVTLC